MGDTSKVWVIATLKDLWHKHCYETDRQTAGKIFSAIHATIDDPNSTYSWVTIAEPENKSKVLKMQHVKFISLKDNPITALSLAIDYNKAIRRL